ncbi:hypothetical protein LSTR_LSTR006419 [Laodelphax striatellus]|uniref:Uncharacterized protein n=1 Tax=Laodelphax striatellus TaxID=195883 RepID=A0A482WY95_LAOST|nr:hypothetical protein LSTR_LSTR006419 [Laodelphax striatellus]
MTSVCYRYTPVVVGYVTLPWQRLERNGICSEQRSANTFVSQLACCEWRLACFGSLVARTHKSARTVMISWLGTSPQLLLAPERPRPSHLDTTTMSSSKARASTVAAAAADMSATESAIEKAERIGAASF